MLPPAAAEIVSLLLLVIVLGFAVLRPHGLPELIAAGPAAATALLLGLLTPADALAEIVELGPTVAFLGAILLLGRLAEAEGVFRWLGQQLGARSGGRPDRLLGLTFVAASITTAVLSLDATVVLLTPVVLATTRLLRVPPRPHTYACAHLANSASLLLPVSNLTNLLAFAASGLSFTGFAALMAGPWLLVIAIEYLVFRVWFRAELRVPLAAAPAPDEGLGAPRVALVVLGLTLAGFGVSSLLGVEPVWVALLGALLLGTRSVLGDRIGVGGLARAMEPQFCLFVLALAVVVQAVAVNGLGRALGAVLPVTPTLAGLLLAAALAALLSNLLNNIPAALLLLAVLGATPDPGIVLAVLIGVNIGPNLSYLGSLATLLWRRVLEGTEAAPTAGEFHGLGALSTPVCLVAAVLALWAGLQLGG
ncbi:MAG TPA: SLC13 family permease [Pseudonocardia sp.]|nr:SLC13 family permease [Pseudonocardia sp.]